MWCDCWWKRVGWYWIDLVGIDWDVVGVDCVVVFIWCDIWCGDRLFDGWSGCCGGGWGVDFGLGIMGDCGLVEVDGVVVWVGYDGVVGIWCWSYWGVDCWLFWGEFGDLCFFMLNCDFWVVVIDWWVYW